MRNPRGWLRLWFTFEEGVGRREYLISGIALAVVKYAGDVLIVRAATGRLWSPLDYLSPVHSLLASRLNQAPPGAITLLALWSLPFLWIGISMSMRRALDAGRSAWLALLFFVPGLSYLLMALLAALPPRVTSREARVAPRPYESRLPGAMLAIAAGGVVGVGMIAMSVYLLRSYGVSLFLGTPFVVGALTAFLFNRRYPASARESQEIVLMTILCIGGVALVTAAEGAICLIMALPLALVIAAMGAALGRWIALHGSRRVAPALFAVVLLPAGATVDASAGPTSLREVRSAIVVDAPPAAVWEHVISFPPLPEPSELVFRTGIAYPKRAEIRGSGVGAVRYCVFSTGAFVEPITVWEPGRRLSFDVVAQPAPMTEWSLYASIAPPHLDGYFRSRRGEFRLVPLPGGRTRLEGSTWYEMRLYPAAYWVLYGDALVARIHRRVLEHVKNVAEGDVPKVGSR